MNAPPTETDSLRRRDKVADYATAVCRLSSGVPLLRGSVGVLTDATSVTIQPALASDELLKSHGINWFASFDAAFRRAQAKGLVTNIVVHGSYGDFTYTCFSDIEVTVVLTQLAVSQPSATRQLSSWIKNDLYQLILEVDPLQHHGAFFLWPDLLGSYSEAILPVSAYQKSWAFSRDAIVFKPRSTQSEIASISRARLRQTLFALLNYERKFFRFGSDLYSTKRLLSNFFMVPVYFYQSRGSLVSKRDALRNVVSDEFPEEFCAAMEKATLLRERWPKSSRLLGQLRRQLVRTKIPQCRMELILASLWRDAEINIIIQEEFLPLMIAGCKSMLDDVSDFDEVY